MHLTTIDSISIILYHQSDVQISYRKYKFDNKMPKAVDIYVLDKKIGCGQFGDVYKGYSKVDSSDVAIKTIRRDKIKGKFTELLDNQIQVLKSCQNNNIIRLIDIKKTANNIYLILQYCNEGDLNAYLKQKIKIPQQQAVEYFVQILHAFQTLVKNKIMHRDFKLPNVLKHEGCIKIADFGFSKLLGSEDQQVQTILGSPLNMAPEVLDHQAYNSKADIWSIGVAFYELLFGRVPYTAANIIDLLKKIKKEPLTFPYKVNPAIEDVLRKMLVVDPAKRIEWNDLFKHPVTRILEDRIQGDLQQSMLCQKEDLPLNMSKFYIKTNKVIDNIHDIIAKKELNKYVKDVIEAKQKNAYHGTIIKRNTERENKENMKENQYFASKTQKDLRQEQEQTTITQFKQIQNAKEYRIKANCKIILHQRNIYAFLGHLAQDLIQIHSNIYAECLSFLIVKKIISKIGILKQEIKKKEIKGIQKWEQFEQSGEIKELMTFISNQEEIFNRFYEKLALKVLTAGTLANFEQDLMISGKYTLQETNNRIYQRVLKEYINRVLKQNKTINLNLSIHLIKIIDSLKASTIFSDPSTDFMNYYQWFTQTEESDVKSKSSTMIKQFLKDYSNI